ncbi:hypothetical protein ThvES_00020100, partial [Thiovulum sp. ES]
MRNQSFQNMLPPRVDKRDKLPEEPHTSKTVNKPIEACEGYSCSSNSSGSSNLEIVHKNKEKNKGMSKSSKLMRFKADDWVFTQVTAITSAKKTKDGKVSQNSFQYVNTNGIAISNEDLLKYYKSFIGSHNYKDHEQEVSKSYGVVLDAVIRPVNKTGDTVYYVDLLIATNRHKDPAWARAIETQKVKYVSMGADSSSIQCSKCGNIAVKDTDICEHLLFETGLFYIDKDGNKQITSGWISDKKSDYSIGSIEFEEISYLTVSPAYRASALSYVIPVPKN